VLINPKITMDLILPYPISRGRDKKIINLRLV
jgi:hypothetical protein